MTNPEARIWRWTEKQPEPAFVDKWRTPGRTRFLVATYFTFLTLALILELAALWWFPLMWFFFGALLIAVVAWTVLRSTIRMRDAAPREELDDYEQAILDLWRGRALGVLSTLLVVGGVATIVLGLVFADHISTPMLAVFTGLYMIFSYLAITTLPAVGYALTFNQPTED